MTINHDMCWIFFYQFTLNVMYHVFYKFVAGLKCRVFYFIFSFSWASITAMAAILTISSTLAPNCRM